MHITMISLMFIVNLISLVICGDYDILIDRQKHGDVIRRTDQLKLDCVTIEGSNEKSNSCKCKSTATTFHQFPNKTKGCYSLETFCSSKENCIDIGIATYDEDLKVFNFSDDKANGELRCDLRKVTTSKLFIWNETTWHQISNTCKLQKLPHVTQIIPATLQEQNIYGALLKFRYTCFSNVYDMFFKVNGTAIGESVFASETTQDTSHPTSLPATTLSSTIPTSSIVKPTTTLKATMQPIEVTTTAATFRTPSTPSNATRTVEDQNQDQSDDNANNRRRKHNKVNNGNIIVIIVPIAAVLLILVVIVLFVCYRKRSRIKKQPGMPKSYENNYEDIESEEESKHQIADGDNIGLSEINPKYCDIVVSSSNEPTYTDAAEPTYYNSSNSLGRTNKVIFCRDGKDAPNGNQNGVYLTPVDDNGIYYASAPNSLTNTPSINHSFTNPEYFELEGTYYEAGAILGSTERIDDCAAAENITEDEYATVDKKTKNRWMPDCKNRTQKNIADVNEKYDDGNNIDEYAVVNKTKKGTHKDNVYDDSSDYAQI